MKEADIRPEDIHNEYLKLSAADAEAIFSHSVREKIDCPACGGKSQQISFTKHGFDYAECADCGSLFQSPRPSSDAFENFYMRSVSSDYWAKEFFPRVAEARRKLIFEPRVQKIIEITKKYGVHVKRVLDVGAGYGVFLEEWKKCNPGTEAAGIEPGEELAKVCKSKGIEILQTVAEKAEAWNSSAELVTCFEVFEHVHKPIDFICSLHKLVKEDGLLVLSTLSVDGFDIQTLWQNSKSIMPPHHINFLSVKGLEILFKKAGFKSVEVITPGVLDVEIVMNYKKANPNYVLPRFLETMAARGPEFLKLFQVFLADNKLSSHTWIIARK